jgi:hypothetical protein
MDLQSNGVTSVCNNKVLIGQLGLYIHDSNIVASCCPFHLVAISFLQSQCYIRLIKKLLILKFTLRASTDVVIIKKLVSSVSKT